ncbi:hypothetical protein, partial [Paenibacillus odorifer]|uniref:hypothetical protein n=1 Tax=Paenibacillus odorifer TaxID=189426 RepID=UPI001BB0BA88
MVIGTVTDPGQDPVSSWRHLGACRIQCREPSPDAWRQDQAAFSLLPYPFAFFTPHRDKVNCV